MVYAALTIWRDYSHHHQENNNENHDVLPFQMYQNAFKCLSTYFYIKPSMEDINIIESTHLITASRPTVHITLMSCGFYVVHDMKPSVGLLGSQTLLLYLGVS